MQEFCYIYRYQDVHAVMMAIGNLIRSPRRIFRIKIEIVRKPTLFSNNIDMVLNQIFYIKQGILFLYSMLRLLYSIE